MKELLKFFLCAAAILFWGCFPASSLAATLSAPERVEAGEDHQTVAIRQESGPERPEVGRMATWKSNVTGSWMIFPPDAVDMAMDSDKMTVHFVPLRQGTLFVTFFYIKDGTILYEQMPLKIGADPEPAPSPTPSPTPTIKLTDSEKSAARAALTAVIQGVEAGTIRTPQGARSAFKQTLMAKARVCNGQTCYLPASLNALADDWTGRTDFTSAETVKASFESFLPEVE